MYAPHVVSSGPHAGPPSLTRLTAAVARAQRLHAFAVPRLELLFGPCVVAAVARRIGALAAPAPAAGEDLARRVANARQFLAWLSAVAESIETENDDAAELHAALESIMAECDFIATGVAAAAVDVAA